MVETAAAAEMVAVLAFVTVVGWGGFVALQMSSVNAALFDLQIRQMRSDLPVYRPIIRALHTTAQSACHCP